MSATHCRGPTEEPCLRSTEHAQNEKANAEICNDEGSEYGVCGDFLVVCKYKISHQRKQDGAGQAVWHAKRRGCKGDRRQENGSRGEEGSALSPQESARATRASKLRGAGRPEQASCRERGKATAGEGRRGESEDGRRISRRSGEEDRGRGRNDKKGGSDFVMKADKIRKHVSLLLLKGKKDDYKIICSVSK